MFNVADLFKEPSPALDDTGNIKVWDNTKYGRVVDRYVKDGVRYVVVRFNAPGNPPSNDTEYIYLAP